MTDDVEKPDAPVPAAVASAKEQSIFDMFDTDESVETMGVLLRYGPKIRILVARAGGSNKKFEKVLKTLTKPHRQLVKAVQAGTASDADGKVLDEIMQEAYADAVVLGWEGIQLVKNGPEVEFTKANAMALFKKLPQLWLDVREFASNYMNFLTIAEDTEEVAKN